MALYGNPDMCLKRDFRVTRATAQSLMRLIASPQDHGWGQDMEVLVFLYSLAHGLSLSVVSRAFGIPKSTVHDMIHRVSREIKGKLAILISLPSPEDLPDVAQGFMDLSRSPAFDHVAGAMDGCHIRIRAPGNLHQADYFNYKLFPSIQMQAVCDAKGRFLDIFVGYPGSVHDARVLRNSPIFHQALYPPAGYYLLGDGAYPCLETPIGILTPYKHPLRGRIQEEYNVCHARARSVVERAFGMMKARWRATLSKALEVSPAFAPDIIACCAFLHNLCLSMNDDLEDIEMPEPDPQIAPPIRGPERSGNHTRDRIALMNAVGHLPQHLHDHNYW
ncbi:putative nuclease HARBI1 [Sardina pilchardus]|uniref:putative nuclease HARBI1 n=1 Tax=Sardina pilchardus TaxID=27697 RepID=UPI002E0D6B08